MLDEAGPVANGVAHAAAVNEVEFGRVGPVGFDVVDFEVDVWGHPAGLDRAEVIAEDL